ncbi:MAG: bifunctional enoyl-CoA hydratase/phosphate acetyltransferase [Defluviitaleaceae bacterium]|nr:bifunctional enoyl-CoA hydratase/phosphate acetyltransferase [Defluviitaleaceae bacterium]
MLKNFEELKGKVLKIKEKKVIALACAADAASLEALRDAEKELGVDYLLIGDAAAILDVAGKVGFDIDQEKILQADDEVTAAEMAVTLVCEGRADILMKGKMQTASLLKAVVDKEKGIRTGGLMSHMAVLECPAYHKLIYITDGGMVTQPDAEQKRGILMNSVDFLRQMGYEMPKAAVLAAVEAVNPKMQETVDAAALAEANAKGELAGCIVEGPLSFDLAISAESAKTKGVESHVAGDVDIFIAPEMATGNILAKSLIYLAGAKMAGCILGAKAPIIVVSRGAGAEEKMLSILLTMAV